MTKMDYLCAGRADLTPETEVCRVRTKCERYRALLASGGEPITVPVRMWACQTDGLECHVSPTTYPEAWV